MKVVLSGGGTAGHINPALALAESLQSAGHEVFYAGTPKGVEARLVTLAGLPFKAFDAQGFDRSHPLTLVSGVAKISHSTGKAVKWFKEIKPDVVVVFGGYVCIPVGRAATKLGIPLVVHEQNSIMGMANDYLSRHASVVALTYKNTKTPKGAISKGASTKMVVTGNPVRSAIFDSTRQEGRTLLGIPDDALMLLVFGGSLGARHINTAIANLKDELLAIPDLYVVHITGPKELETVKGQLNLTAEERKRYLVMGYQNQMGKTMAATDMVVSRAGATSLAEISARCIPALLVPFPYATADHQTTNAQEYVHVGAAVMISDDQVESEEFEQMLFSLLEHPEMREKMKQAASTFETPDAAGKLAAIVEEVGLSGSQSLQ